ncbi:cytochrome c3 family protein [Geobacter sp.]|uniref:cytochrome c3 family protein n=1 Tax=Geobacter sp. TaxID=46610 RepID=UPI002617FD23|nr:cytochrome c3 family protein [Geobacter sp.]
MNFMRAFILASFLVLPSVSPAAPVRSGVHLDRQTVPQGCSTCHLKFNFKAGGGPETCIVCHGDPSRLKQQNRSMPKGFAPAGRDMKNIEAEFTKPYRHPSFDVRGAHSGSEVLPETDPRAPRHADCVDCHNPHYVSSDNKFAGIRGKRVGNLVSSITQEYELCYRCHAESANLPGRFTNKRMEFNVTNPSYHPVEAEGKNTAVVSLVKPYKEKKVNAGDVATITCGDCHGSESSASPRGPHGSLYEHILVDNYSTLDNQPETPYAYALCYRCHNRTSILGNESFRYHALHIQGTGGLAGANGTSCYTCHNSHGSIDNRYLIRFNPAVVYPNSKGMLKFVEKGVATFHGECYLSCHGVDHDPKSY